MKAGVWCEWCNHYIRPFDGAHEPEKCRQNLRLDIHGHMEGIEWYEQQMAREKNKLAAAERRMEKFAAAFPEKEKEEEEEVAK